jgi:pyruvate/2-oxoglutarate/acetoin dehydrogenase E1 component
MTQSTIGDAVDQAVLLSIDRDERHVLLHPYGSPVADAALARSLGERALTLPVAADAVVGVAIGMSLGGMRPIVTLGGAETTERALYQLMQLGGTRKRVQARLAPKVTIRVRSAGGDAEGLFSRCPGLRVIAPAAPKEATALFLGALRHPDPVVFLEPLVPDWAQEVPDDPAPATIDMAKMCYGDPQNAEVLVVTFGRCVRVCRRAGEVLEQQGIRIAVLDLCSLQPLDEATIAEAVQSVGRCVVVTDGPLSCSIAPQLVTVIEELAHPSLRAPVIIVGAPDVPPPAPGAMRHYRPHAYSVIRGVRMALAPPTSVAGESLRVVDFDQ